MALFTPQNGDLKEKTNGLDDCLYKNVKFNPKYVLKHENELSYILLYDITHVGTRKISIIYIHSPTQFICLKMTLKWTMKK